MNNQINNEMLDERMADILDAHAEGLMYGEDRSDELLAQHGDDFPMLASLFALARNLREAMVPVDPGAETVEKMRVRILQAEEEKDARVIGWLIKARDKVRAHPKAVSTVLSVFAVAALVVRVLGSIVTLIWLLARSRRRRGAAAV